MVEIVLNLSSNMGDRIANLSTAVSTLLKEKIISNIKLSPIYESKPILLTNSPKVWNVNFLNIIIRANTDLLPNSLIKEVKSIEKKLGKTDRGRWGPKEIAIEVIAIGEEHYLLDDYEIPHKLMLNRESIILPFIDIYPNWRYPVRGEFFNMTIKDIKEHLEFRRNASFKTELELQVVENA